MYNRGWIKFERETAQAVRKNGDYRPKLGRIVKHKAYHKPGAVTRIPAAQYDAQGNTFTDVSRRSAVIYNR